jgi:nucleotide-binding universal stress UspA family protein
MYRNILVGYDGSEEARDALALAGVLRDPDGVVTAACVTGSAPSPLLELEGAAPWLRTRAVEGSGEAQALLGLVHEIGADLFVLGSSHRGEAGRMLTGAVGRRLLFGCPCPVAVAPRQHRHGIAAPRLVGIAFEAEGEAASAADEGARLAQSLDARVRLLCLVPPLAPWALEAGTDAGYPRRDAERHHLDSFRHVLEEALACVPSGITVEARMVEGRPASVLLREADNGIDLMVLASPGVRPVPSVRPGATAIEVMESCRCPILLTPTGERSLFRDARHDEPTQAGGQQHRDQHQRGGGDRPVRLIAHEMTIAGDAGHEDQQRQ